MTGSLGSSMPALVRALLLAIAFAGLPLLWAVGAYERYVDLELEGEEAGRFAALEAYQQRLVLLRDPETLLRRVLFRLVQRAYSPGGARSGRAGLTPDPVAEVVALAGDLARRVPGLFSFNVFDATGRILFRAGDNAPPALPRAVRDRLVTARARRESPRFAAHVDLARYLGQRQEPARCDNLLGADWFEVSKKPTKTWVFFHHDRRFSLLVHVHQGAFHSLLGISHVLRRRRAGGRQVHAVDLDSLAVLSCRDEQYRAVAEQVAARFAQEPLPRLRAFGRLWTLGRVDARFVLLSSVPYDRAAVRARRRQSVSAPAVLLFLAAWGAAFILPHVRGLPRLSLRIQVLTLFVIAGGLPLSILAVMGSSYIRCQDNVLIAARERAARQTMAEFEQRFAHAFRWCDRRLEEIVAGYSTGAVAVGASFTESLARLLETHNCNAVYLLDPAVPAVVLKPTGQSEEPAKRKLYLSFLQALLRQTTGQLRREDQLFLVQMGMGAEQSLGMDFEQFIDGYLRNEGRITPMSMGPVESYTYLRLLPVGVRPPTAILAAHWRRGDLEALYFDRHLGPRSSRSDTQLVLIRSLGFESLRRVGGRSPTRSGGRGGEGRLAIRRDHRVVPARPLPPAVWSLFDRVRAHGQPVASRISDRSGEFLVCGQAGVRFPGYALFSVSPLADVSSWRQNFIVNGLGFFLGFVAFAGFFGVVLAWQFLVPIRQMAQGTAAVRAEQYGFRVPHAGGDEFGALATQFNAMVASLASMADARVMQSRLLPAAPMQVGQYMVCGLSRPMTELGGDYFDYLVRSDDRLLVVHGDVSGHGAPAAMVMAMVKGVVSHLGATAIPVVGLLDAVAGVVHRVMKRELMMTLAMVEVDTRQHTVTFFNCGNPFPLVLRNDGTISEIEAFGPLVGFAKKSMARPVTLSLAPGERLVFFSDGLFESLAEWETDGFAAFKAYVATMLDVPASDLPTAIIANHPYGRTHGEFPDDVTVVVVARNAKAPGASRE